jgi:hypothetical protein
MSSRDVPSYVWFVCVKCSARFRLRWTAPIENRLFDRPSCVRDVMSAAGLTLLHLEKAGVENYDFKEIRKCMKS